MTLAERILELRTRQKLSQGDLAERLEENGRASCRERVYQLV